MRGVAGADGLRAILDQVDAAICRELLQGGEVHQLAEQVNRDDGLRARRDPAFDFLGIKAKRAGIDVGEDDLRAHLVDRLRRRDVGERRGDHFVAGTDVQRAQGEGERVGAGVDADAVLRAGVSGDLLLECLHVWPEDVMAARERRFNGRQDLRLQRVVLRL